MFLCLVKKRILNSGVLFVLLSIFSFQIKAQNQETKKFKLSGKITSNLDSSGLGGASVRVLGSKSGTITDSSGNYTLFLIPGNYTLEIKSLGFQRITRKIQLRSDVNLNFPMEIEYNEKFAVTVRSKIAPNQVKNFEMGVQRLEMKTIKKLPALLGEPDILKTILSLPGISTVGEGATGFNVRGGGIDENLILMDGEEVYNSSHLFGFFSVYNPEAVDDATLIKGGIPAQYGGRLSSILDVKMLSGNPERIEATGGIGTVSSRLALGGPIQKGKSEFFITGRRSYVDLFLKLSKDQNTRTTYAYYYDVNSKLSFHLSPKDELEISGFYGKDVVNLSTVIGFNYGNGLAGLNWKHKYNSGLRSIFNFGYSNYDNNIGIPSGINGFNYNNAIGNFQAKMDFETKPDSDLRFKYGLSLIRYNIVPGTTMPVGDSSFLNPFNISLQRAYEAGAYIQAEQRISRDFSAQYGLRLSGFDYVSAGQDTIYSYSGLLGQALNPVNPRVFSKGQSIKAYGNLEPRISLRYILNNLSSLKASYNRTTQYIHLISNTTAASPFDIWATTSNNIPPQSADQVSFGYFRNALHNEWEASSEVYYKISNKEIDYVNGAMTILNKNLEGELLYGTGKSYGLELYLKKNSGKLNGWLSYTLSKSLRKIPGINNDTWYPSKYDRTHNLALVGVYDYSTRWNFSANFIYQSGVTTTFPDSRFNFQGLIVPYNSGNNRNNYRLPSYNRLDISATLNNRQKPGKKFHSSWVFSLYNVYRRKNAYSIYFRQDPNDPAQTQAVRLSILGTAVPGITWNFNY